MTLPTLHHPTMNQSRSDYQTIGGLDQSDSRLNKSRLLEYGGYANEMTNMSQYKQNVKYGLDHGHLPNIKQND
jgi:hypothetical protein